MNIGYTEFYFEIYWIDNTTAKKIIISFPSFLLIKKRNLMKQKQKLPITQNKNDNKSIRNKSKLQYISSE